MNFNGYVAIEGPIGVGKTVLAEQLAETFGGRVIRELAEENPFLPEFYKNGDKAAFQTQVFFLMSRFAQQKQLANRDLFSEALISDYLFNKDRIFAGINLNDKEFSLYDRVASSLETEIVRPDLVIYLTATIDTLVDRIRKRGRDFEKGIDRRYLETVCESYSDYFFHYGDTPLLVVKTDDIDFSRDKENFSYLVDKILSKPSTTEYIAFDKLNLEES
ncbi:MAG: deoxynucleoside kinase [candidate division Zixibacteria bacterium]